MKKTTIAILLVAAAISASLSVKADQLKKEDQRFVDSLADIVGEQAGKYAGVMDGMRLNGSLSSEDQKFLQNTVQAEENAHRGAQSEFVKGLQRTDRNAFIADENKQWLDELQVKQKQKYEQQLAKLQEAEKGLPSGAYYFVSFSIPGEGLKQMIADAADFKLQTSVRGLIDGDWKKTADRMLQLVSNNVDEKHLNDLNALSANSKGGVAIDPEAFTKYNITAVPALVVRCDAGYDVVSGNVTIKTQLERIAKGGECKDKARELLKGAGYEL